MSSEKLPVSEKTETGKKALFCRQQPERKADRIMVGAGKAVIQDGSVQNLNIRRDKEAVDRQPELPVGIRPVGIAAAGDRRILINWCDQNEIRLCDQIAADGLRALLEREDVIIYCDPLYPDTAEAVYLPAEARYLRGPDVPVPEVQAAISLLAQAKGLHDELEAVYNPHVDFARVYALANSHVLRLLREN